MSILQQVIEEFGISESPEALTDKTDKRIKSPRVLTAKTDKMASVSSVSEWSELLENKNGELTETELLIAIEMVAILEMRERGQIPAQYTSTTTCIRCGPVPIWEGCPPEVQGCPWCFNRIKGLPIPNAGQTAYTEENGF